MQPSIAEDRYSWLTLLGCGLDRAVLTQMVREATHPRELLEAPDQELVRRFALSSRQLDQFHRRPGDRAVSAQLRAMDAHRMDLIPLSHPGYPRNLFHLTVPPPAIFVQGVLMDFDCLAVGIVGPRQATPYGLEVARKLAWDFSASLTVVSGAAMGVDSVAHDAAMNAGGRTIGVLGCGMDVNYPAGNEALRRRIASGGGALLSVFTPGTRPLRGHFPARNVILAGLSLAVVVVEASATSGALTTARAAGDEGRPVYVVPGDITRRNSEGSNGLLRDGASVCTRAGDVIADLEAVLTGEMENLRRRRFAAPAQAPQQPPAHPSAQAAPPQPGSPEETLLGLIRHAPISHDDLMDRLVPEPFSVGDLATALLMLELKGRIQQLPGRVYAPKL